MAGKKTGRATCKAAERLLEFLAKHRRALSPMLILTHNDPDPDALAAAFALQLLLQQYFGVESKIAYGGGIGRMENRAMTRILRIPAHKIRPGELKRFRQVALVDTQPCFANNVFPANRKATLVIDQHPADAAPVAELALVDPFCGATCVIVAQALLALDTEIPTRVATALAYGILSDTLDLYRARRPDVAQTYLDILPRCDMRALARIQNPAHSRAFFVALGRGITQAAAYRRVLVSHLGPVANPELVAQVAEFLATYRRSNWAFCTGRYKGGLYVSLRAERTDAPAAEVLRDVFPRRDLAGGHGPIAGGRLKVGKNALEEIWLAAEQSLQANLARRLRIPSRGEFRKLFQP